MKNFFLAFCFIFCALLHVSASDTTIYVFPCYKFSLNKTHWAEPTYAQYFKSFSSYLELVGNDNPGRKLSVFVIMLHNDDIRRDHRKYFEQGIAFETKNGKVSDLNGYRFSTRTTKYSAGNSVFFCNGFYLDSNIRIGVFASGSPSDSSLLVEDVAAIIKSAKIIQPEDIDRELGLPLSQKKLDSLVAIQNKYIDEISYSYYFPGIDRLRAATTKETIIKEIRDAHSKSDLFSAWAKLPPLEKLSLDSLIHIQHRYYNYGYYHGDQKLKLVAGLYPPQFSVRKYYQHTRDLTNGNFTLDELLRKEAGNPVTIDNVLYPLTKTYGGFNPDNVLNKYKQLLSKYFPGDEISRVYFGSSTKDHVTAEVEFKNAGSDEDKGYVYFTLQKGQWKAKVGGRPVFDRNLYSSSEEIAANNYRVRIVYNKKKYPGGMFFIGAFIKPQSALDQNWTEIKTVTKVPGNYKVVYQYRSAELKNGIVNKELFEKANPFSDYNPSIVLPNDMAIQIAPNGEGESVDEAIKKEKRRLAPLNKFAGDASPQQRLYICEYDFFDINGDGIKDMLSFSISDARLLEMHIYTISNKAIKELPAASFTNAIKKSTAYQFLIKQSLLEKHIIE